MKKKILILGASVLQLPAIIKAKEMGLYVVVVDMDPNAIGFKHADEHYVISTTAIDEVIDLSRKIKPDGVMTLASDKPMLTVAKVGETLGLNTISVDTAIKATNKARMREILAYNKIPIPKFKVVNSKKEYLEAVDNFDKKFIVKPADSSGSRGIFLVDKNDQIIEAYDHSRKYSSTGEVLIEEYIDGPEVSVESITIDGKTEIVAITDKYTTGAPHFVELGHVIPSVLSEDIILGIKDITINAIDSLDINIGPSHTEIKITKNGPKIIEVGARLGGDNITTHLVPLATNIDIVKNTIELSLNNTTSINNRIEEAAAIRYFKGKEGKINSIKGINLAKSIDGINEIEFTKCIGEKLEKFSNSNDRLGFVISKALNSDEALKLCEQALELIDIDIV